LADAAEKHPRSRDEGENATENRQVFGLRICWLIKERINTPPPGDDFPSLLHLLYKVLYIKNEELDSVGNSLRCYRRDFPIPLRASSGFTPDSLLTLLPRPNCILRSTLLEIQTSVRAI